MNGNIYDISRAPASGSKKKEKLIPFIALRKYFLIFTAVCFVLGLGAKLFTIAGPVIVYGTVASVLYGVIYWISTLF